MPARRPMVLIGGQLQQLPAGDTLDAPVSEVDVIALNNGTNAAAAICRAVYPTSSGFALARADASATKNMIGLIKDVSVASGASGNIQSDGVFVASAAQWEVVTGVPGGLTAGAIYYLSPTTAGGITATPPSTTGQYIVQVGIALSATAFDIRDGGFDILL